MTSPQQQPPWSEHRALAETVGQAVAESLGSAVGSSVKLSKSSSFDPQEMLEGRPLPVRGFVVRYHRPLRDVAIFLTSHKPETVRPLVERAAQAIVGAVDVPDRVDAYGPLGAWEVEEVVEFDELELALEQCDALFLEATYALDLPNGELRMVLGTGLLESASCFVEGVADAFADEAPYEHDSSDLALGDAIDLDDPARIDVGDMVDAVATPELEADAAVSPATSAIDDYEAMLAAQEGAESQAAAAHAAASQAAASANVAAAELPDLTDQAATRRWTQLLSGVEVELSAELGRTQLALGDITSLAFDSVLALDQLVHEAVTVFVNGTPYATARLVVVDGEYGIEILTVVQQDALVTSLAA